MHCSAAAAQLSTDSMSLVNLALYKLQAQTLLCSSCPTLDAPAGFSILFCSHCRSRRCGAAAAHLSTDSVSRVPCSVHIAGLCSSCPTLDRLAVVLTLFCHIAGAGIAVQQLPNSQVVMGLVVMLEITSLAAFACDMLPELPDKMPEACLLMACLTAALALHYRSVSLCLIVVTTKLSKSSSQTEGLIVHSEPWLQLPCNPDL